MPLNPTDLATLSRLLDEALDLSPAEFEVWLAALPAEHRHLLPRLRDMLASQSARGNTGFLSDGPKIEGAIPDDTIARGGDQIGPYRLIREIGHGGMGTVWLAERADGTLKRQVALKLPRLAWGAGLAERMARERDIGALLEHPHIARLYDAGVDARGRPYLALEYVDGQPIDTWCRDQKLDVPTRLKIFLQVVRAVAYAHGRLVVHRDLKPSNVLVTKDGQAHLLDFGIAKLIEETVPGEAQLTRAQDRLLTPHYASPEQIRGEAITVSSDVYSLGVLLYELLTEGHPHAIEGKSVAAIEQAIVDAEPALASSKTKDRTTAKVLRGELDAILGKALKREPNDRYATADALAEDIERHLDGERVLAQPESLKYYVTKAIRRNRTAFVAMIVVLLAIVGGAGIALVQVKRASEEAARALAAAEKARAVKEFMIDIFRVNERGLADNNALRKLPAEVLLDRGARLIETKFVNQPELQSELYGVVARILLDLGGGPKAVDYARKYVDALESAKASPASRAEASMLLSRAWAVQRRVNDAVAEARKAESLAAGSPELQVQANLLVADQMLQTGRPAVAILELSQADARLAAHPTLPRIYRAEALFLHAQQLAIAHHLDEARPLYKSAIQLAIESEGASSARSQYMGSEFAAQLMKNGFVEEATTIYEATFSAMRATDGVDDFIVAYREAKAAYAHIWADFMRGQVDLDAYSKVDAVMAHDQQLLESLGDRIPTWIAADVMASRGCFATFTGRVAKGYELSTEAERRMPRGVPYAGPGTCVAFAAMMMGRHEQAEKLMSARSSHARLMGGKEPWAVHAMMELAMNRMMAGDIEGARVVLDDAPEFAPLGSVAEANADASKIIGATRAAIDLEAGDYSKVMKDVADLPNRRLMMNSVPLIRGFALCALGETTSGLALLREHLGQAESSGYEFSPGLAFWRARVGLCELAAGNRTRAARLALLARRGIDGESEVSPFFERPVALLERKLHEGSKPAVWR